MLSLKAGERSSTQTWAGSKPAESLDRALTLKLQVMQGVSWLPRCAVEEYAFVTSRLRLRQSGGLGVVLLYDLKRRANQSNRFILLIRPPLDRS